MPTRRDDRRTSYLVRYKWPKVVAFLGLLAAAGLLTFYALSQSAEADGARPPEGTGQTHDTGGLQSTDDAPQGRVPQIDLLGDSYLVGSAEGGKAAANWTRVIGARFHDMGTPVEMNVMAQPGSGYLARGISDLVYREAATLRLRATADAVVVFGSRNDGRQTDAGMYEAARTLYADIRDTAPQADVVVIGPVWNNADVPDFIIDNNEAMARAAEDEGVRYIDTIAAGWFADTDPELIGADGIHPTDEGHLYLADKIFPIVHETVLDILPAS